jgi:glycosyltransferase involved in cell wall biosynthesis
MSTNYYFLFYLYLEWEQCNQRELIKALAEEVYPHKIVVINRPADLPVCWLRHRDRLAESLSKHNIQYIKENLVLYRPFFPLNDYAASWIPGFNSLQCLWLRSLMARFGLAPAPTDQVIIWLFSYMHWPFARLFPSYKVVYHPVDDYTLTAQGKLRPQAIFHEKHMFKKCDVVFTLSEGLAVKKGVLHSNIHCLGQGVTLQRFSHLPVENPRIPQELEAIPRPRLGLVGNIRDWIDFPLLSEVIRRNPDWSVVFIGPQDRSAAESMESLRTYGNFFWLGPKPFEELPRWLAGLDVGLIPYLQTEFTKFINPTKLYEYWAAGLPVIITNIGEFQSIDHCLWISNSTAEFINAIKEGLHENAPHHRDLRRQLANAHSWDNIAKRALGYLYVTI